MSNGGVARSASPPRGELRFGPYRLAGPHGPLRHADSVIDLPRKPLALLWTLATRAGEVVTKDELLAAVWPRRVVTEGVISASLRDLRRALGDDARQPRFIATAHRIGYRFIAEVEHLLAPAESAPDLPPNMPPDASSSMHPNTMSNAPAMRNDSVRWVHDGLVGREAERRVLQHALEKALAGQRQLMFVTGEPGIGKSRLVDSFVSSLAAVENGTSPDGSMPAVARRVRVGHGQCIEHYGSGEPYLPILEAVTRLCRQPDSHRLLALLRQHAPTWLSQLPGLFDAADQASSPPAVGANPVQRVLREMAEAIDAVAAEQPLVLVFEDLHWSDRSTVDWLAMLARRREPAQLLVLATCRPVELIVNRHPLKQVKQELIGKSEAREIVLGYLAEHDVRTYMDRRMDGAPAAQEAAAAVFNRSQGHPLFMVHMADDLQRFPDRLPHLDSGTLPGSVRELIDTQLARLPPEQLAVLEAAAVAGAEFASATVAAALREPVESIEEILDTLTRHQQFVDARGLTQWWDGTVCGRYGFLHDIYRDGLYRRLGAARRVRLHAAIGERLSSAFGDHCADIAAELALHFESAKDAKRAAQHLRAAAEKALQRYAYREALALTGKGLELLAASAGLFQGAVNGAANGTTNGTARTTAEAVDDAANGAAIELGLHLTRGVALLATRGYSAPEVEATYTRALALGIRLDDSDAIGPALSGLYNLYLTRADFGRVAGVAEQVLERVERRPQPVLSMLAHNVMGTARLFAGDAAASLDHVDRTLALYDAHAHRQLSAIYGDDPAVACHHYATLARWIMGFPETAARHLAAGFELASSLADPYGEAQMLWIEAVIALDEGDVDRADRATSRLHALCVSHEFPLWLAGGQILRGVVLAARGDPAAGAASTEQGLRAWREAGTLLTLPHALGVAAQVQTLAGRPGAAHQLLDQALDTADRTGERWYEPELHRLRGELILASDEPAAIRIPKAQESFERAIGLARQQQARLLELRSCASLAGTWVAQGRTEEARSILATTSAGFPERLQGRDMQRVAALLARMPPDQGINSPARPSPRSAPGPVSPRRVGQTR